MSLEESRLRAFAATVAESLDVDALAARLALSMLLHAAIVHALLGEVMIPPNEPNGKTS